MLQNIFVMGRVDFLGEIAKASIIRTREFRNNSLSITNAAEVHMGERLIGNEKEDGSIPSGGSTLCLGSSVGRARSW